MDIKNYVREAVFSLIGDTACDPDRVIAGIDAYTDDNGFAAMAGDFDDTVIRQVVRMDLEGHRFGTGKEAALYFSNYRLIEKVRILSNKALKLSLVKEAADPHILVELERELEECLREVGLEDGLYDMLEMQFSEIVLNLDHVRKGTDSVSQRKRDAEVR